ncbi:MAG: hypothetical protein RI985_521 [Chloroflexota bacterium]
MNPIHVRYQAALRPESDNALIIRYCDTSCQIKKTHMHISIRHSASLKGFNTHIRKIIGKAFKIALGAKLGNLLEQQITILSG